MDETTRLQTEQWRIFQERAPELNPAEAQHNYKTIRRHLATVRNVPMSAVLTADELWIGFGELRRAGVLKYSETLDQKTQKRIERELRNDMPTSAQARPSRRDIENEAEKKKAKIREDFRDVKLDILEKQFIVQLVHAEGTQAPQRQMRCQCCRGTGEIPGAPGKTRRCSDCKGSGTVADPTAKSPDFRKHEAAIKAAVDAVISEFEPKFQELGTSCTEVQERYTKR